MSADLALAILDQQPDGDLLAEVSAEKPEDIRWLVPELLRSTQRRLWKAALLIERVEREELFREWADADGRHYTSTADWASHELGYHKSTTSRYLTSARDLLGMPQEDRGRWVDKVSPFRLHAVHDMVKSNRDGAFELATSKRTDGQVRQTVKESQPDQHWDTSGLRTLKILLSADVYAQVKRAMNAFRHQLGVANPNDSDVMDRWVADFLSGYMLDVARMTTVVPAYVLNDATPEEYAALIEVMSEDVLAGRMRCIETGAWWPVQRHHAIPRSHKIKRPDGGWWSPYDPAWPCVYLSAEPHRRVTENIEGTWRECLARWIADPKNQWLREKVDVFLAGRSLASI